MVRDRPKTWGLDIGVGWWAMVLGIRIEGGGAVMEHLLWVGLGFLGAYLLIGIAKLIAFTFKQG